ncbi:MAG: hypothetical protein ACFCU7_14930 [Pleurocapsa sp.]
MLISNLRLRLVTDKLKQISAWVILLGSLVGCRSSLIAIEGISPQKIGKTVYLKGKVVHLAPFVDNAAYQIEDATGKIWVITTQKPPEFGQLINIKGKIEYQSLLFADQELGEFYVIELEQLPLPIESE